MSDEVRAKIKITSFTDIKAWQEGHKLVLKIYEITNQFPARETYSLVDQMRRAASSITSNIAEGFGRQSFRDRVKFYYIAQGSLTELKNQILIAKDIGYIKEGDFEGIAAQANTVHKLLHGFILKSKSFIS